MFLLSFPILLNTFWLVILDIQQIEIELFSINMLTCFEQTIRTLRCGLSYKNLRHRASEDP